MRVIYKVQHYYVMSTATSWTKEAYWASQALIWSQWWQYSISMGTWWINFQSLFTCSATSQCWQQFITSRVILHSYNNFNYCANLKNIRVLFTNTLFDYGWQLCLKPCIIVDNGEVFFLPSCSAPFLFHCLTRGRPKAEARFSNNGEDGEDGQESSNNVGFSIAKYKLDSACVFSLFKF